MSSRIVAFSLFVASALLVACGGGGGPNPPTDPPPTSASPSATPTHTANPPTTQASGTLVDDAANTPLAGVPVALQPWVENATPIPEPTTNAQGQFAFTAADGHYLLIIGSNSATDTRATVHDNVTLLGGAQPLVAPTEWPMPTITPHPSEVHGAYRLMTLDATIQTPCLSAVNAARANLSLPALVPDEWLEENSYAANQAQNNQKLVDFPATLAYGNNDQDNGSTSCSDWVQHTVSGKFGGTWGAYAMLASPYALWYGGAFMLDPTGNGNNVGWEEWGYDPTIDHPCPSPPPSPQPTPGPGGCDPVYQAWP